MGSLPLARPPLQGAEVGSWPLHTSADLSPVRRAISHLVTEHDGPGADPASVEHIVLVTSELATNALRHARPPARVILRADETAFLLEVVDSCLDADPVVASGRGPGEGGFGLVLAEKLASAVGWFSEGPNKHIWATFPRSACCCATG